MGKVFIRTSILIPITIAVDTTCEPPNDDTYKKWFKEQLLHASKEFLANNVDIGEGFLDVSGSEFGVSYGNCNAYLSRFYEPEFYEQLLKNFADRARTIESLSKVMEDE